MTNENNSSDLVRLTGLWNNEGRNGPYFGGNLGMARLLVFPNKYKRENSNDPDYLMCLAPKDRDNPKQDATAAASEEAIMPPKASEEAKQQPGREEDIPC